jgi:hypothetical protein
MLLLLGLGDSLPSRWGGLIVVEPLIWLLLSILGDYRDPVFPAESRRHWAFQAPAEQSVPTRESLSRPEWPRNAVDQFILARLDQQKLAPAPEADRATLIRRLSFDLLGLPPTPEEIDRFVRDPAADAYEKLVDRYLASEHYGERWAQHWLDVVRFAETNGYEADGERPHAWRYRDYVIRAFNSDMSYDQFLREQIAGDLLAERVGEARAAELRIATGLHRCGPVHVVSGNIDREELRQEIMNEMVSGLSSAVLGLTVSCARCHDHKFDPISLGDYYRLQAYFARTEYQDVSLATASDRSQYTRAKIAFEKQNQPLKAKLNELERPVRDRILAQRRANLPEPTRIALNTPSAQRTPEQDKLARDAAPLLKISWDELLAALTPEEAEARKRIKADLQKIEAQRPTPLPAAWSVVERESAPFVSILRRGDLRKKSGLAFPATLSILKPLDVATGTREDLANWLLHPDHPLTARVMVNRLWQHHFGEGLVRTPNDFGTRGDPPTHPELLDWLAREFRTSHRWKMKSLHKLLVTSATYRQRSDGLVSVRDPENQWWSRMNRRRLDAESIRDAILAAAGSLNRQVYGPSIKVPLEPEVYDLIFTEGEPDALWPVTPDPREHTRRSIYLFAKRNVRQPLLEAFDQPDTLGSCAVRGKSTSAPQALILMNGPLTQNAARYLAERLIRLKLPAEVSPHPEHVEEMIVQELYLRCLSRKPTPKELRLAVGFLIEQEQLLAGRLKNGEEIAAPEDLPEGVTRARARAVMDLCVVVFNLNETILIP